MTNGNVHHSAGQNNGEDVLSRLIAEAGTYNPGKPGPTEVPAGIDGDYIDSLSRPSNEVGTYFESDAAW